MRGRSLIRALAQEIQEAIDLRDIETLRVLQDALRNLNWVLERKKRPAERERDRAGQWKALEDQLNEMGGLEKESFLSVQRLVKRIKGEDDV